MNMQTITNRPLRNLVFFVAFLAAWELHGYAADAEPSKVSLLLGDSQTRTVVEAIKAVWQQEPALRSSEAQPVQFQVYSTKDIRGADLMQLKKSRVVMIQLMERQLLNSVRPEIEEVIKHGGKVYAVDESSYRDEHKTMGIRIDDKIKEYYQCGGVENLKNMLLYAIDKDLGIKVRYGDAVKALEFGLYDCRTKRVCGTFEDYMKVYVSRSAISGQTARPWVGITFNRIMIQSGSTAPLDAVIESLEREGFNVLPAFGFPADKVLEKFFFDDNGQSRVRCLIGMSMKMGMTAKTIIPLFSRLKIPVIDAITLYSHSREEWEKSPAGLDIFERAWQIGTPEMVGIIQPTVFASKEKAYDRETGIEYIEERPIAERVQMLVRRVKGWVNLQEKPNEDKRIAIIYYNYPPGKNNIGASYLNVLPGSLYEIASRLKAEGYNMGDGVSSRETLFDEIHKNARNIGQWAPAELACLVRTGKPVLIPLETYQTWFAELPNAFQMAILKNWGPVDQFKFMIWKDAKGKQFLVIPAVKHGNVLFTPQPTRGWEEDPEKLFHDVSLAPHHQYVAFYLWLQKEFKADAVAHIGTHGTHEWLPGKEAGLSRADAPEALIQDLPNIYPYIVDDVGEGLQAKRRGMAVVIDHLTSPFDKAGLNKDLKELASLLSDFEVANEKSAPLAGARLREINERARKMGLFTDLGLKGEIKNVEEVEQVEHYIKDVADTQTPFGLHTFGKPPDEKAIKTTAEAIVSLETNLSEKERQQKTIQLMERIRASGKRELDSFTDALSGKYIPAAQGNDPLRNPDSLPTGNNFYAFDPTRIPSKGPYEMGVKLARELIEGYQQRHGQYPNKLTFNLWCTETIRHEGVMESQIMFLMGIRPKWDGRGKVIGVEAIPRAELGRPRIDVTIVPSGLYRDVFSNLMDLLDKAVSLAKQQDEKDNILRANVAKARKMLIEKGVAAEVAERLASVRMFTTPPGAYGPNVAELTALSNTWNKENQIADVYLKRMSHMYGQGFWGDRSAPGAGDISQTLFTNALSGTKITVHSRSSNVYGTLDNDDLFQDLGGVTMAVRVIDGKTPEVYLTEMSNPRAPKQETLEKVMGREMRARYLNPEWIKKMMNEGYAGARFVDKTVEYLWGWQVTVPEAVDAAKWNEMYETFVLDKNGLNIKEMFRQSKNLFAYQSLVARMLETIRKQYWKPDRNVVEILAKEYAETVKEAGLACCDHTCNNPQLAQFTSSVLISVPGLKNLAQDFNRAQKEIRQVAPPSPSVSGQSAGKEKPSGGPSQPVLGNAPGAPGKKVKGYEMQEANVTNAASSAPIPWLFLVGFLVLAGLFWMGFRHNRLS